MLWSLNAAKILEKEHRIEVIWIQWFGHHRQDQSVLLAAVQIKGPGALPAHPLRSEGGLRQHHDKHGACGQLACNFLQQLAGPQMGVVDPDIGTCTT
jgi:hypothetical protein